MSSGRLGRHTSSEQTVATKVFLVLPSARVKTTCLPSQEISGSPTQPSLKWVSAVTFPSGRNAGGSAASFSAMGAPTLPNPCTMTLACLIRKPGTWFSAATAATSSTSS